MKTMIFVLGMLSFFSTSFSFAMTEGRLVDQSSPPPSSEKIEDNWEEIPFVLGSETANLYAIGCEKYPFGGIKGLDGDLLKSIDRGFSCLKSLGRVTDLETLNAYVSPSSSKRPKVFCSNSSELDHSSDPHSAESDILGRALNPGDSDFPGLVLNTGTIRSSEEAQSTLFHEMMHWLGYKHSHGIDITYLVEYCCFGYPQAESGSEDVVRNLSCKILSEQPAWASSAFQAPFFEIMLQTSRSSIAFSNLWAATASIPSSEVQPLISSFLKEVTLMENLPLLANLILETFQTTYSFKSDSSWKDRLHKELISESREFYAAQQVFFAKKAGKLSALLLSGKPLVMDEEVKEFLRMKERVCASFSSLERSEWNQFSDHIQEIAKKQRSSKEELARIASWMAPCVSSPKDTSGPQLKLHSELVDIFELAFLSQEPSLKSYGHKRLHEIASESGTRNVVRTLAQFLQQYEYSSSPYRAFPSMMRLLTDEDALLREIGAAGLVYFTALDRDELFELALKDSEELVRMAALRSIQNYKGPNLEELKAKLKSKGLSLD